MSRGASRELVQPTLRRLRDFDIHPDRELGQCFLVDSNILGVIDSVAELAPDDIVLEVGGGLGVLSEHLAQRVAHVHVIEVDRRLREALCDATDPHANVDVHWADAMKIDLSALTPRPDKLVANLPYQIAAGMLLRTVQELADVRLLVAMVQREVGERLRAAPGESEYGAPSVMAQLECEVEVVRAIPRTVFFPVPNVDSVLVRLRRRSPALLADGDDRRALRALVAGAFAHRRKTLAGSLKLSGLAQASSRERVRAALVQLGHRPDERAERLSAEDFLGLARLLDRP